MEIGTTIAVPPKDGAETPLIQPGSKPVAAAEAAKANPLTAPTVEPGSVELATAVAAVNEYVQVVRRELQFNVDDVTGRVVVKVLDSDSQETVRQIPSEVVVDLARRLHEGESLDGAMLDEII